MLTRKGKGNNMIAINGYYDGTTVKPLEKINAKPNQRVIIIIDEFQDEPKPQKRGMRGVLSEYANPELANKEEGAWERAVVKKYGNA